MRRLYTCLDYIFIVLISLSTVISTFHSHHDIQWNSTQKHADTGHSITVDSGQCPVCGYLFKADPTPIFSLNHILGESDFVNGFALLAILPSFLIAISGRSPPVSG